MRSHVFRATAVLLSISVAHPVPVLAAGGGRGKHRPHHRPYGSGEIQHATTRCAAGDRALSRHTADADADGLLDAGADRASTSLAGIRPIRPWEVKRSPRRWRARTAIHP